MKTADREAETALWIQAWNQIQNPTKFVKEENIKLPFSAFFTSGTPMNFFSSLTVFLMTK